MNAKAILEYIEKLENENFELENKIKNLEETIQDLERSIEEDYVLRDTNPYDEYGMREEDFYEDF